MTKSFELWSQSLTPSCVWFAKNIYGVFICKDTKLSVSMLATSCSIHRLPGRNRWRSWRGDLRHYRRAHKPAYCRLPGVCSDTHIPMDMHTVTHTCSLAPLQEKLILRALFRPHYCASHLCDTLFNFLLERQQQIRVNSIEPTLEFFLAPYYC